MTNILDKMIQKLAVAPISWLDSRFAHDVETVVAQHKTIDLLLNDRISKREIWAAVFVELAPSVFWISAVLLVSLALFVIAHSPIPLDIGGAIISVLAFYFGVILNAEALFLADLEKFIRQISAEAGENRAVVHMKTSIRVLKWRRAGAPFRNAVHIVNSFELLIGFVITAVGLWLEMAPTQG